MKITVKTARYYMQPVPIGFAEKTGTCSECGKKVELMLISIMDSKPKCRSCTEKETGLKVTRYNIKTFVIIGVIVERLKQISKERGVLLSPNTLILLFRDNGLGLDWLESSIKEGVIKIRLDKQNAQENNIYEEITLDEYGLAVLTMNYHYELLYNRK